MNIKMYFKVKLSQYSYSNINVYSTILRTVYHIIVVQYIIRMHITSSLVSAYVPLRIVSYEGKTTSTIFIK